MKFNSPTTRKIYSGRSADSSWSSWCENNLFPQGKRIIDIGCGGGIYASAFSALGAQSVIGVDQSAQYISDAIAEFKDIANLEFVVGSALNTGLDDKIADIVFERALIHHLTEVQQMENAMECHRLLFGKGVLAVQDRTIDDVLDNSPEFWIRSTLIECFPRLIDFEKQRRPSRERYQQVLKNAGFDNIKILSYPEVRKRYQNFDQLEEEIMARKGKSTLYQLDDDELHKYCKLLKQKDADQALVECDLWTVWLAQIKDAEVVGKS